MRYLIIVLLCCMLEEAIGRPQTVTEEYRDSEEAEYENEDEAPEDSPNRDDDAAVDDRAYIKEEDEVMEPHHNRNYFFKHQNADRSSEERSTKENTNENFSDLKSTRRYDSPDEEASTDQPVTGKRYDRHNELNNPRSQFIEALVNQKGNGLLRNFLLMKRKDNAIQEESNDMLYDNDPNQEHVSNNDKNKRNDDSAEPIGQSNYYNNYRNRPQTENKESEEDPYEDINGDDANRDRRDAKDPDETTNGSAHDIKEKKDFDNFENEAEQAIIQRYVKKLNKKEVENLMRTLSQDKRAILEQIIGSDENNQAISLNKREITKKAEAVEENNFMDSVQSDTNKVSGPLANFNVVNGITNKNNDVTAIAATPAIEENFSSTKIGESKINRRSNEDGVTEKLENGEVCSTSTEPVTSKSDNKREVNFDQLSDEEFVNTLNINEPQESSIIGSQDELYGSSQDQDMSQLMEDDAQLNYDNRSPQKRDLMQENNEPLAEPMKSLQESFSDNNNYENSGYTGDSNMPLIRVKRKNNEHAVKKRAAAVLPESKVAYVPENEDEDNDEGNEVYDNGFFDRTASFAKSNERVGKVSDSRGSALQLNIDGNTGSVFKRSSEEEGHADEIARDTTNIGSDTDSVLSGIEGVNENLMYSGGCRKKRAAEEITKLEPVDDITKVNVALNSSRSSLMGDIGRPEIFGVSFNSNDAFGSPSKSYDGELGRYKRIRRLKQHAAIKSSTTKVVKE